MRRHPPAISNLQIELLTSHKQSSCESDDTFKRVARLTKSNALFPGAPSQSRVSPLIGCEGGHLYVYPTYHSQAILNLPVRSEVNGPTARSEY